MASILKFSLIILLWFFLPTRTREVKEKLWFFLNYFQNWWTETLYLENVSISSGMNFLSLKALMDLSIIINAMHPLYAFRNNSFSFCHILSSPISLLPPLSLVPPSANSPFVFFFAISLRESSENHRLCLD